MDRWHGRIALVTGASAGIGAAICRRLAEEGMQVVGCARNVEKIQQMALEVPSGSITAIKCDLRDEGQILAMFEEIRRTFGRLDLCVNNAGLSHDAPLLSGSTDHWRDMLEVNVLALCICSREALRLMSEAGVDDGQILHIGSMSGHRIPEQTSFMYVATKHAVKALTEGLRREMKAAGLRTRIACISPGLVETEFEYRCFANDQDVAKEIYSSIHCLRADDVAGALLYVLATPPHVEVHDILVRPVDQLI